MLCSKHQTRNCHCEEPFGYAQDKLRDEAISIVRKVEIATPAHAIPSPDGKRVLWASNWESSSGRPIGAGAYVADTRGMVQLDELGRVR